MDETDVIAGKLKEFDEEFFQDFTGEKVEGWLCRKTGKIIEGDERDFRKIAIPSEIKAFISSALHDSYAKGREFAWEKTYSDLITIADNMECEDMRREVELYFNTHVPGSAGE